MVAATNPLFPKVATMNRLRWAGFDPEDFALFTTYEHYHYCKPNPAYYTEVLASLGETARSDSTVQAMTIWKIWLPNSLASKAI